MEQQYFETSRAVLKRMRAPPPAARPQNHLCIHHGVAGADEAAAGTSIIATATTPGNTEDTTLVMVFENAAAVAAEETDATAAGFVPVRVYATTKSPSPRSRAADRRRNIVYTDRPVDATVTARIRTAHAHPAVEFTAVCSALFIKRNDSFVSWLLDPYAVAGRAVSKKEPLKVLSESVDVAVGDGVPEREPESIAADVTV